jgi:hypothetical protein
MFWRLIINQLGRQDLHVRETGRRMDGIGKSNWKGSEKLQKTDFVLLTGICGLNACMAYSRITTRQLLVATTIILTGDMICKYI